MNEKTFTFQPRNIKIEDSFEVIVVGGGPSGCAAAAAAAREGAKTILLEATSSLGGMGTSGLVPSWTPYSDGIRSIYGGIAYKVLEESKKGLKHVKKEELNWVPIDPEYTKRVFDDLIVESGAKILFNTVLSAVEVDADGNVTTILVTNKAGLTAYKAKVYIDCTGDADLAAWAGAEFTKGDDTGDLQPATHCFVLSNVDSYAYQYGPRLHDSNKESPIHKIVNSGEFPLIEDAHFCNQMIGPGAIGFNAGHIWNVDNTDPESTTKALLTGRKMAAQIKDALEKYQSKTFGNAYLSATGSLLGVRETRRIVGDYILSEEDYINRASFADEIGRNNYFIDVHHSEHERSMEKMGKFDWDTRCAHYGVGESHGIPYRCITPMNLKNVLIAGRSISCDRAVQGSVRVMPVCMVTGEAAGIAAAFAAKEQAVNVHQVDVVKLRARLKENGAYLPDVE